MLTAAAAAGWLAAGLALLTALAARRGVDGRTQLVDRAAHELRGALTAVRLALHGWEVAPARRRAVDLELGRATLALDDLSAGSGLRIVGLALEPVEVGQLLADSVEAWRPAGAHRNRELRVSWTGPPATVLGDRYRLAQATDNLIANAIEHGEGTVEVSGRLEGTTVRVSVTDEGPGLAAPVRDLTRRARKRRRGRGQGLAIASAVAQDHRGRLAAAPSERRARVVIELPVAGSRAVSRGGGDSAHLN